MITPVKSEWVADLAAMTCWNTTNNIVVVFEKLERNLVGKIQNMPLELVKLWAADNLGYRNIRNAVMEAQEYFSKAYLESEKQRF
jgi:hypothetical protein